jgi:hypothetical protein
MRLLSSCLGRRNYISSLTRFSSLSHLIFTKKLNMHFNWISAAFCTFFALVSAIPDQNKPGKGKTCTVKSSGSNVTDDAPAIREAFKKCGRGGKVIFKPTTYYVNTVLNVSGLEDVDIDILGELSVSNHSNLGIMRIQSEKPAS